MVLKTFHSLVSVVALALSLCFYPTNAQVRGGDGKIESMVRSVINDTYDYRFADALKTTDSMIASYPSNPEGYLYKCGVRWKMLEEGCSGPADSTYSEMKRLIDKSCSLSEAEISKSPNDVMALFDYAGALVYRARLGAINRDWFTVMSDGVKSRSLLKKALEIDPNFYDAYSGIGAFNYFAANIPWYLKPIAFVLGVSGSEEEGLEQLRKASEYGKYSRTEAAEFLGTVVYTNKEEYSLAAELMTRLHNQYPLNLEFTRNLCWDLYKLQSYRNIIGYSDSAIAEYRSFGTCHSKNLGYLYFMRASANSNYSHNYAAALADFSRMLELSEPQFLVPWSHYGRGVALLKLNRVPEAISDFESVLKSNPDTYTRDQAKAALDSLTSR